MPQVVVAAKAVAATWAAFAAQNAIAAGIIKFVASTAVAYGISRALAPKAKSGSVRAIATEVNVRDPAAPRQIIYGQRKVSGIMYPVGTSGANNDFLHLLLLVAGHECQELGDIYFNDEVVTLDGSGNATGRYAGFVRIKKHLGTYDQTVDTSLQSDLGSSYWTNNHRLRGIAYLYIRLKVSQDLFAGGLPEFYVMAKGRKVWDPRDGAQSATDATTWTWSSNAALCLLDWARGVPMRNSAGTLVRNFGLRAVDAEIDTTALNEAANICDENVTLADATTEKRYAASGVIATNAAAADGIEAINSAMAGECVYIGGKWVIRAGAYRTPTVSLNERDLRGPLMGVQIKPSRRELANGVKGVYISPLNNWQPSDFPPVTNSTYTTQDGGERLWRDIELPFTTSAATAQRLAKIILERSRQTIAFTAPCKLTALRNQVTDVVQWSHDRFGWSNKTFEVIGFAFVVEDDEAGQPYLGVNLSLRETAAGVWDWADGEETTVDLAPNTNLPDPFNVAAPTSLSVTNSVQQQDDGTSVPRLMVAWTAPADIHVTSGGLIRVEYKLSAASDWLPAETMRGDITTAFILAVVIGQSYTVRVRAENNAGVSSAWVQHASVSVTGDTTAPGVPQDLAAVAGTGKAVSLGWTANSEPDVFEYGIYRHTSNSPSSATKIAEVSANRFVDVNVNIGTQYFYWVTAIDGSENESAKSTGVSATPGVIGSGTVDTTAPSNPAAATLNTSGAYNAGDGTVFSRLVINVPAMPSGAVVLNVLYRRNGTTGWILADQRSAGGSTSSIDDLTPGQSYEIACQAFSVFGYGSAIVAATGSPFTAPNSVTAPASPTGGSFVGPAVTTIYPRYFHFFGSPVQYKACRVEWAPSSDRQIAYYEWVTTEVFATGGGSASTNFDGAWAAYSASQKTEHTTREIFAYHYSNLIDAYNIAVRAVDRTGNRGSWTNLGDPRSSMDFPAGSMSSQQSSSVAITGGTVQNITDLAVADGGTGASTASGARGNLGLGDIATQDKTAVDIDGGDVSGCTSNGFVYAGGANRIKFLWDGSNVRAYVDDSLQGTIPNP